MSKILAKFYSSQARIVRENYLDVSEPKYLEKAFNNKQKRSILQNGDVLLSIRLAINRAGSDF